MYSDDIKRVGIIFSGGPAPAANAVISSAAVSFLEDGREVIGFFHGYSNLIDYSQDSPLQPDTHYRVFDGSDVRGLRNERGICIGTARSNPGKGISGPADLADPTKTQFLRNVYNALVDLGVDALISIGGDDTLKTANFLFEFQKHLPADAPKIKVVHLPKTIDNDYNGIDFTFGFFTAVDFMAKEVLNLRADAMATSSYFIVETMGRKAGWLPYGVAVAGEANLVIATEDLDETLLKKENQQDVLDLDSLCDLIADLMITREQRDKKHYGVVVLAEGLAELLPDEVLQNVSRDEHGHLSLGKIQLGSLVAVRVAKRYNERTGRNKKTRGIQLGYESRCSPPHAFDVILGSQLGIGAYRALVQKELDGHMVSVVGQLDLTYVPFSELVDPETMVTQVRMIEQGSDFHQLARFLETRGGDARAWSPGRRNEPRAGK
jgi:ATP-dependent phosphofructokinase / diphosphate-dependent phosphofructokinase